MELTILITLVALVLIIKYVISPLKDRVRLVRRLRHMRGPRAYPLIGNLMELLVPLNRLLETIARLANKHSELFLLWMGPFPFVVLLSPEYMQAVLENSKCLEKGLFYKFFKPWLGAGLFTSTAQKWKIRRKMLTPTFHFKILENFLEVFSEESEILVRKLQKKIGSQSFDIYPYINRCTLDIICKTAMGIDLNSQTQDIQLDYVKALDSVKQLVLERVVRPWLYPDFIYYKTASGKRFMELTRIMHDFSSSVIRRRRERYGTCDSMEWSKDDHDIGKKKPKIFLDLLLEASENGVKLSDEEILEEVETLIFGGHDTTTSNISWTIQMLGKNQVIQDKVCEELETIFQGSDRPPTMSDLNEMKYLERVIKETMRLYPPAPSIFRQATEDIELGGYKIPAGVGVMIPIFYVHRMAEHFPNPMNFDPDNFLPERVIMRHPCSFIPFSAGPRNCIGQKFGLLQEKTILSYILRHYIVHAVHMELSAIPAVVLEPENGVPVTVTPRNMIPSV